MKRRNSNIFADSPTLPVPHSRIYFEIEDTGLGIATDELDSLFEAFTQTKTGRETQEGTGLGWPISRKFVHLMGGELTVSSQPGQGTLFVFTILAHKSEALARQDLSVRQILALEPHQPRYRLLIVDDKWDNRQLLIKILSPFGFELQEAGPHTGNHDRVQ